MKNLSKFCVIFKRNNNANRNEKSFQEWAQNIQPKYNFRPMCTHDKTKQYWTTQMRGTQSIKFNQSINQSNNNQLQCKHVIK